ncbi:hypothetical protein D6D17_04230 [Aureobasidium pullulans]|uniref:Small ribosomal subunit protein mS29 n=1 Tax=Aureobasidium pullulans TaxID=5580 RepID=A0A4S9I6T0_AURPU|nr:hypothetical protein D6D24_05003 [Aureobasidium pullulans]THW61459.1 hypothetical protein D6D25_02433 [Aureobasidium pullulans]THX08628.1 hypothetical protein D6D17_04230 [Aureobasidium pullulans]THX37614.1 hypothetical protein D6D10_05758 [Aureobasidium pullulans]THX82768.1 hypothetical protein D6D04_03358 [Aureobasidium pullulans]
MSGSICLRCLARPAVSTLEQSSLRISAQATAAFSTSAPLEANPVKKKGAVVVKPGRGANASFSKQGKIRKGQAGGRTGKPPGEGERKAIRKRVVLSNTNAVEVQGLDNLSATNIHDAAIEGQVMGLSNEVIDALRATEAFKPTQGWSLFRRPATLVRKETAEVARLMKDVESKKTSVRRVIYGERGSGKSVLALQAKAMALLKGWIIVHIPEAKELILGHTSYAPSNEPGIYNQPHFAAAMLGQIAKANHSVLSKLRLSKQHDLSIPVQSNISLDRFAMMGAQDPDIASEIYNALWSELTAPSQSGEGLKRPPVIFTIDSIAHVMRDSAYMNPDVEPIHAHDLAIVNHFFKLLSGKETLSNGGIVLATDSGSNRPGVPGFDHAVARNAALAQKKDAPQWDPWVKVDQRTIDVLNGVDVWQIKGLSREEARSIMEYYAKSGMLRQTVNDNLVGEKWTLSGGGIIGELEKGTVKTRI